MCIVEKVKFIEKYKGQIYLNDLEISVLTFWWVFFYPLVCCIYVCVYTECSPSAGTCVHIFLCSCFVSFCF